MASLHGLSDLRSWRVHHRDEPEEGEVAFEVLGGPVVALAGVERCIAYLASGDGEHPQPAPTHVVVGLLDAMSQRRVQWLVGPVDPGLEAEAD